MIVTKDLKLWVFVLLDPTTDEPMTIHINDRIYGQMLDSEGIKYKGYPLVRDDE